MTRPNNQTGAWIFISHSHLDLEKVRQIRNYLEVKGANPLLFFLKCLDDNDARLPKLIRDEIESRDWFIYCDSPDARASKYVRQEIEIVKRKEDKVFEEIDLGKELEPQLYRIDRLLRRATVFLSYARQDYKTAERMSHILLEHDYRVWTDSAITPGKNWKNVILSAIDEAATRGFVLVLLSPASLASPWCEKETKHALKLASNSPRSNIIPVIIAPLAPETVPHELQNFQYFDLTNGSFDERVEELIRNLKTREME